MIPVFFQKTWEAVQTTGNRLVIWITAFVPRIADNEAVEYWRQIVPLRHPNPTLPAIATEPDSVLPISRHCIGGVLVSVRSRLRVEKILSIHRRPAEIRKIADGT